MPVPAASSLIARSIPGRAWVDVGATHAVEAGITPVLAEDAQEAKTTPVPPAAARGHPLPQGATGRTSRVLAEHRRRKQHSEGAPEHIIYRRRRGELGASSAVRKWRRSSAQKISDARCLLHGRGKVDLSPALSQNHLRSRPPRERGSCDARAGKGVSGDDQRRRPAQEHERSMPPASSSASDCGTVDVRITVPAVRVRPVAVAACQRSPARAANSSRRQQAGEAT